MEALTLLREMISLKYHVFWPDDIPLHREPIPTRLLAGHRQVTDAYLLGLCIRHKGKLITLDCGVAALLPPGKAHSDVLEILSV